MQRLDGQPKKKWKWTDNSRHKNNEYHGLDRSRLQYFKGAHDRVRDGKSPSIEWPRNREGYIAFCKEMGPIPEGMVRPSVGRKNHAEGYAKNNVQWEEHSFNSAKRKGTRYESQAY